MAGNSSRPSPVVLMVYMCKCFKKMCAVHVGVAEALNAYAFAHLSAHTNAFAYDNSVIEPFVLKQSVISL